MFQGIVSPLLKPILVWPLVLSTSLQVFGALYFSLLTVTNLRFTNAFVAFVLENQLYFEQKMVEQLYRFYCLFTFYLNF
mgnify:FL=1